MADFDKEEESIEHLKRERITEHSGQILPNWQVYWYKTVWGVKKYIFLYKILLPLVKSKGW